MANAYRPHLIANERGAYLLTCKKELAESLVAHLNHRGIIAELSDAEATKTPQSDEEREPFIVQQIDLNGEYQPGQIEAIVSEWSASQE